MVFGLTRPQFATLAILVIGSFVTILNQTIVNPSFPTIMRDFAIDAATVQWLSTGFTMVNAILIPTTAFLTDRYSTRRLFLIAMGLFTTGSLLAAWGPHFYVLLAGRLVQAAGAGMLMPMASTVMLLSFPLEKRGTAMGVMGIILAMGPAIGPTLGGALVDAYGWHIMFYIISVMSIALLVSALVAMEDKAAPNAGEYKLDRASVVLSSIGFGATLFGFSTIGSYGPSVLTFIPTVIGVVVLVFFFHRQLKLEHPMLKVQILGNRRFLVGTILSMLVSAGIMANGILIPIFVQNIHGFSATVSGLVLLPGALAQGLLGPIAGRLFDKHGPRALCVVGTAVLALATGAMCFLSLETSMFFLSSLILCRYIAMALINMPATTWGLNALRNDVINHGNALNNSLRQVAGSLGTALVISVYSGFTAQAAAMGESKQMAGLHGFNVAFWVQTVLFLAAFVLAAVSVRDKESDIVREDPDSTHKMTLEGIMKRDVYMLPATAKIVDAVQLFVEKGVSAAPLVNEDSKCVGIVSDGDVIRALSRKGQTYIDPIAVLITNEGADPESGGMLEMIMELPVTTIATMNVICINVHASFEEVCSILGKNHLKKAPVVDDGVIVGVINRSDVTRYAMQLYFERSQNMVNTL